MSILSKNCESETSVNKSIMYVKMVWQKWQMGKADANNAYGLPSRTSPNLSPVVVEYFSFSFKAIFRNPR